MPRATAFLALFTIVSATSVSAQTPPHMSRVLSTSQATRQSFVTEDPTVQASTAGDACLIRSVNTYEPATQTKSAAFYFPWFHSSGNCTDDPGSDWCRYYLGPKPGAPRPQAGYYSSSDVTATTTHLQQMQGQIDIVAIEWTNDPDQRWNIDNVILPQLSAYGLKFVILYDLAIRVREIDAVEDGTDIANSLVSGILTTDMTTIREEYFGHPQYFRLANKPVLYMYVTRTIGDSSGQNKISTTFRAIHDSVRADARFRDGMYLVADHIYWAAPPAGEVWKGPDYGVLVDMGASAASAFGPVTTETAVLGPYGGGVSPTAENP